MGPHKKNKDGLLIYKYDMCVSHNFINRLFINLPFCLSSFDFHKSLKPHQPKKNPKISFNHMFCGIRLVTTEAVKVERLPEKGIHNKKSFSNKNNI